MAGELVQQEELRRMVLVLGMGAMLNGDQRVSPEALEAMARELVSAGVGYEDVCVAVKRASAVGDTLSIATIARHLPGGHPTPEQAWVHLQNPERTFDWALAVEAYRQSAVETRLDQRRWLFQSLYRQAVAQAIADGQYYAQVVERRKRGELTSPRIERDGDADSLMCALAEHAPDFLRALLERRRRLDAEAHAHAETAPEADHPASTRH
jgi:hypothetical protein